MRNGTLKIFSLAFACGLWLLVNAGERDTERTLVIPIELSSLPPQLVVVGGRVDSVDLRVRGPRTLLGRFRPKKITLNLSGVRPGPASFHIGANLLRLPRGVSIERISPSQVDLEIAAVVKRTIPVRPHVVGTPPHGYVVKEVQTVPNTVEVVGPAPQVEKIETVTTAPLDVSQLSQSQTEEVPLRGLNGDLITASVDRVRARVEIQEVVVTQEFRRVKIEVKNAAFRAVSAPARVDVAVRGPQRLVEQLQLWDGEVFVDATGQTPGTVTLPINVLLPPGIELISQEPSEAEVTLTADEQKKAADEQKKPQPKQTPGKKKSAGGRS
ncbi:MAG TPA: CdaR family protein [Candidatus Binatia bacterium]|nr:CdaR family protein [Candidatus Binatia bacterium]